MVRAGAGHHPRRRPHRRWPGGRRRGECGVPATDHLVRIGVLGASRIAEAAIVGPAAELGHRLVAVAARDRSRADVFAEKYGVERVLDDYQAVIDDAEVDVVYNPLAN